MENLSEDQTLLLERKDYSEEQKAFLSKKRGTSRIATRSLVSLRRNTKHSDQVDRGDMASLLIRDVMEDFNEHPKSEQVVGWDVPEMIAPEIWTTLSAVPDFLRNPATLVWTDGDKNSGTVEAGMEESSQDSCSSDVEPGKTASRTRNKAAPTFLHRYYKTFVRADGINRNRDACGAGMEKSNEGDPNLESAVDSKV